MIFLHIIINVSSSMLSIYLAYSLSNFEDAGSESEGREQKVIENRPAYIFNLILIMVSCLGFTVLGKYVSSMVFMSISRNFHQKVVTNLLQTHMKFFDENPSGRIINRLSCDVKDVDLIVFNFLDMIDFIIKCAFSVVFIVFSSPMTIVIVVFQLYYFYSLRKKIITITRDCFRLKAVANSPIVSLITDSVNA